MKIVPMFLKTIFMITVTAATAFAQEQVIQRTVIASVGNKPLYEDEFRFYIQQYRAACISYFTGKYGAINASGFWTHVYENERPIDWLKSAAMTACRKDRAVVQFMASFGISPGFEFAQLDSLTQRENQLRGEFASMNKPVYGNIHFDRQTFYAYLLSNGMLEARRRFLINNPPPANALQDYYEKIKAEKFKLLPTRVVALTRHRANGSADTVTLSFEPVHAKGDELEWGNVYQQSLLLHKEKQQVSFADEAGNECILTCMLFRENGYMPFAQAQEIVKEQYAAETINNILKDLFNDNKVNINQSAYDAIFIE